MSTDENAASRPEKKRRGPRVDPVAIEQKRSEIVREAARLFEQYGYHATNMELVANAVGLKKPTLYHYMRDKEQILSRIHEDMMGVLLGKLNDRVASNASCADILHGIYEDIFQHIHEYPGFPRAFFESYKQLSPEARQQVRTKRNAYLETVTGIIAKGMADGIIRPGNLRVVTNCFLAVCNWAYQWYRPDIDPPPVELAETCWSLFSRGLLADAASPAGKGLTPPSAPKNNRPKSRLK